MKIRTTVNERTERNTQDVTSSLSSKKKTQTAQEGSLQNEVQSKVELSTAKQLQAILNPEAFAAERSARVAELKKLVDSGSYFKENPSSKIAEKVGQSLGFEINLVNDLLSSSSSKDEE